MQRLVSDLLDKIDYQLKLNYDNKRAMKLVVDPIVHSRSKHIEVEFHFIWKKVLNDEIKLANVDLKTMLTSSTKLIRRQSF